MLTMWVFVGIIRGVVKPSIQSQEGLLRQDQYKKFRNFGRLVEQGQDVYD